MTRVFTPLIIIIICFSYTLSGLAQTEFTQKIIAVVNSEAITQTDIDEILAPIYLQYKSTYSGAELAKKVQIAKDDILNQLIEDKLILQQAKKDETITVSEKEIDTLVDELRANFKTAEEFAQILKNQKVTLVDLRKRYKQQMLIKKAVSKEVLSKISIAPSEVSDYYEANKDKFAIPEQVRLRSIFLSFSETPKEEVEKKANEIYEQLQKGVEFVELVEKYSEGPNVVDAGDMGFVKRGSLRQEIEDSAFQLDIGKITKPIKTSSGFYIFKVEDKKPASVSNLKSVQDQIRNKLYSTKVEKKLDEWIAKLKKSALIEVKTNEKEKS
ncbi:MAG: peptidylprolyl isomerase [Candidatus Omnitrophica bacterium]|nr:peptidylprolyl isomerase [Candidatus Omnitrophota bacterium]